MYDHILVALDGSQPSCCAGQTAIALAAAMGARVTACHVYGAQMHRRRFIDMEDGLPARYQQQEKLKSLRMAHDRLIDEGFRALSTGYIDDFMVEAWEAGIVAASAAAEGRSYTGILDLAWRHRADLIVLGAEGLGAVGDGMLGGTTTRVLANATCDVLVARRGLDDGAILTGVDGSEEALKAATVAVTLGRVMNKPVQIAAAYDPDFHTRVFITMARSLSPARREEVGLANQEKLHDDIINDGLGKLYAEFLGQAERRFGGNGVIIKTSLLTGKAYRALNGHVMKTGADLIVVGRYGHHRESYSRLGSNAEGLLRTTSANVLLVGGVATVDCGLEIAGSARGADQRSSAIDPQLMWDADAETRLQRVPSFVRSMARRAVENAVREAGGDRVSAADFDNVAARFGMGRRGGGA